MMHGHEKSDSAIVAMKPPNKAGRPVAEAVERGAEAKENANRCHTCRTQCRESVSQVPGAYGRPRGQPSNIRGGSRMQESCTYGSMRGARPRRSRANLRPPSRSAPVIDRLLKNQNPLENPNNLRSSSPHLVVGRRPGNRAAILRSEISWTREPWLFRSLVFGSGIRRLGGRLVSKTRSSSAQRLATARSGSPPSAMTVSYPAARNHRPRPRSISSHKNRVT